MKIKLKSLKKHNYQRNLNKKYKNTLQKLILLNYPFKKSKRNALLLVNVIFYSILKL